MNILYIFIFKKSLYIVINIKLKSAPFSFFFNQSCHLLSSKKLRQTVSHPSNLRNFKKKILRQACPLNKVNQLKKKRRRIFNRFCLIWLTLTTLRKFKKFSVLKKALKLPKLLTIDNIHVINKLFLIKKSILKFKIYEKFL